MSKVKEKWQTYLSQIPGMPAQVASPVEEPDDASNDMVAVLDELPKAVASTLPTRAYAPIITMTLSPPCS